MKQTVRKTFVRRFGRTVTQSHPGSQTTVRKEPGSARDVQYGQSPERPEQSKLPRLLAGIMNVSDPGHFVQRINFLSYRDIKLTNERLHESKNESFLVMVRPLIFFSRPHRSERILKIKLLTNWDFLTFVIPILIKRTICALRVEY